MRIKMCMEDLCKGERYISLLTQASMRYFEMPFAQLDYDMIVNDLTTFSEADYVFLTVLDKAKQKLVLVGMAGMNKKHQKIKELLGFPLIGSEWDLPYENMNWSIKNTLICVNDLHEASFQQITPFQSREMHNILNIEEIYIIGLQQNEEVLGTAILCWKKGRQMNDPERTELFVNLLGTVLLRKRAEEALQKKEDELKRQKETIDSLVKYSPDAIVMVDKDMRITHVNSRFTEIFGYPLEVCKGKFVDDFVVAEDVAGGYEEAERINAMARKNLKLEVETLRKTKEGKIVPVIIRGSSTIVDGETVGYHAYYTDISERKEAEEKIKYLSYHDKLTGLFNRAYFEEQLTLLDNEKYFPLSIIIGDVNGLKLTNDVFGHMEGDKLLMRISAILTTACVEQGIVARWGGDEFAMILPRTDEQQVTQICKGIRETCAQSDKEPVQISIALGGATKEIADENIREIIREAEEKMYHHKLLESKSTRSNMIVSLKKTLFERSHETEEHGERLREMSLALGQRVGLKDHELDSLSLLAILHDIGKIAISEHILTKSGSLSEEEWLEMKRHPEIGYRIAQSSQELFSIAEYILCHHEHWDGKGYPQGLKGEEIPMLSRILTIVDAYDAMTSARVYKEAMDCHRALEEVLRCAGSQFDPEMAVLFVEIMKEKRKII